MRRASLIPALLLVATGCDTMNRMTVDNPVMPDAPPRRIAATSEPVDASEAAPAIQEVVQLQYNSDAPELSGSQVVATVNGSPIFASDVLDRYRSRLVSAERELSAEDYRDLQLQIVKRDLPTHVENLMLVNALKATLSPEQIEMLETQLDKAFESEVQRMARELGVSSSLEVDIVLQEKGSSLAERRADFANQTMAVEYLRAKSNLRDSVERIELIAYYREHLKDYAIPARVKWEQLTISFASHDGRDGATEVLKQVIQALKSGETFSEVVRKYSDGPTADTGGDRGWIEKNSLANEEIEAALFRLPVGSISQVFEESDSFEIVRIADRQQAGYTPFEEVQKDIESHILGEQRKASFKNVLEELRSRSTVVTIFDSEESSSSDADGVNPGNVRPIPIR